LGVGNLLDKIPKGSKITETGGDGRQNETIGKMSADGMHDETDCDRIWLLDCACLPWS
jgi:hypothetical protein